VFFWSCLKILLVFPKCFSNFSKLLVRHTFSISGVFLIEDINLIKRERENCVFQLQVLNRSKSISGNNKLLFSVYTYQRIVLCCEEYCNY
jgi:hypothetical protein